MQMTFTFGDLLTIAAFIVTGVGVYVALTNRLTAIETKLDPIWEWFTELNRQNYRTRQAREE